MHKAVFLLARDECSSLQKCESCLTCATVQGQERKQKLALHSITVGKSFACIDMDFKEMDKSFDDNRYTLVFQHYI